MAKKFVIEYPDEMREFDIRTSIYMALLKLENHFQENYKLDETNKRKQLDIIKALKVAVQYDSDKEEKRKRTDEALADFYIKFYSSKFWEKENPDSETARYRAAFSSYKESIEGQGGTAENFSPEEMGFNEDLILEESKKAIEWANAKGPLKTWDVSFRCKNNPTGPTPEGSVLVEAESVAGAIRGAYDYMNENKLDEFVITGVSVSSVQTV